MKNHSVAISQANEEINVLTLDQLKLDDLQHSLAFFISTFPPDELENKLRPPFQSGGAIN